MLKLKVFNLPFRPMSLKVYNESESMDRCRIRNTLYTFPPNFKVGFKHFVILYNNLTLAAGIR